MNLKAALFKNFPSELPPKLPKISEEIQLKTSPGVTEMKIDFLPLKPEHARELAEMRRSVWLTTYRGIYPDKMLDEFDYPFHDAKNLSMINSKDFSVFFITANSEKAGYLILQKPIRSMSNPSIFWNLSGEKESERKFSPASVIFA